VLTGQLLTSGSWVRASLQWNKVPTNNVDLYRNNKLVEKMWNDGTQLDTPTGPKPYAYKVCYPGTSNCSNTLVLSNSVH
jgi:hypothetical protein